jgi:hypothetical protein
MHLKPSIEVSLQMMMCRCSNVTNSQRGIHNIEHQITYHGSNFIFHDSPGFEAGSHEEINEVWKFIKRRSNSIELKDQLHAIWYFYIGSLHVQLIKPFIGIAYQWIAHVHFCLQNLSSLIEGQGMVSHKVNNCYICKWYCQSSFGGSIHQIWWSNNQWICQLRGWNKQW